MEAPFHGLLTASMVLQSSDDASGCMVDFIFGDLFHDGDQIYYAFVSMPISLSNLAIIGKIQKNIQRPIFTQKTLRATLNFAQTEYPKITQSKCWNYFKTVA